MGLLWLYIDKTKQNKKRTKSIKNNNNNNFGSEQVCLDWKPIYGYFDSIIGEGRLHEKWGMGMCSPADLLFHCFHALVTVRKTPIPGPHSAAFSVLKIILSTPNFQIYRNFKLQSLKISKEFNSKA